MRQQWLRLTLVLIVMSILLPTMHVAAKSTIEVQVDFSVTDKLKYGALSPAEITIKNTGKDFLGDMVVKSEKNNREVTTAQPLNIASGEEKKITVNLNGSQIAENPKVMLPKIIAFYDGGIEGGKKVSATYQLVTQPQLYPEDTPFIFTLTSNRERLQAISDQLKKQLADSVEVALTTQTFPQDVEALALANVLIIDDVATQDLTKAQQNALIAWVRNGGMLVAGTTPTTLGELNEHMPLQKAEKQQLTISENLTIPGYMTTLEPGATVVKTTGTGETLVAQKPLGKGKVVQFAFVIGDQPYHNNQAYGEWLVSAVDMQHQVMATTSAAEYYRTANATFEAFEVSASGILLAIILYVIIVGPILYMVLKKLDKREYAWVIIPTLAVVVAITLFGFGAKDRIRQPQTQQVASYVINEDSSLSGTYMTSLLTNRGGTFSFTFDDTTTAFAMEATNLGANAQTAYTKGQQVVFKDARYWSVQQIQGESFIPKLGKFDTSLVVADGRVEGTVKNNFPFDVQDVAIATGKERIHLGTIKAGATLQVSAEIPSNYLQAGQVALEAYQYTAMPQQDLDERLHQMVSEAAVLQTQDLQSPILVGWTDEPLIGLTYEGKAKQKMINYLAQPITATLQLQGDFSITSEVMNKQLYDLQTATAYTPSSVDEEEWYFEGKETVMTLEVPAQMVKDIASIKQITVEANATQGEVSIWNATTQAYEDIERMAPAASSKDYIDGNQIKLLLTGPEHEWYELPIVELKGVAQ